MKKLKLAALAVLILLTSGVTATAWSGDGRDYGGYGYDSGDNGEDDGGEDDNDGEDGEDGEDDDGNGGGGGGGNLGSDSGNGSSLYAQACASCHGASSRLRGTSVSSLSKAIGRNKGGMGYLSYLTAPDIQSIAGYINGVTAATPTNYTVASGAGAAGVGTGAGLYAQYCSSCHGANGKRGATTATISNAISSNAGGMIYLSSLTATQIQEIANHLSGTATATSYTAAASAGAAGTGTGAGLYAQYCSSCHGANGKRGATTTTISNAISGNTGGMIYLSSLTATQIQEIANYLSGTVTTSGATATQGSGTATPISETRVFAYAEANHRSLFAGAATAGRYQQYSYRYYPDSQNYLAVDSAGEMFVFGFYTGGVLIPIGSVESIRKHITDWEAAPGSGEAASESEATEGDGRRGNARRREVRRSASDGAD